MLYYYYGYNTSTTPISNSAWVSTSTNNTTPPLSNYAYLSTSTNTTYPTPTKNSTLTTTTATINTIIINTTLLLQLSLQLLLSTKQSLQMIHHYK